LLTTPSNRSRTLLLGDEEHSSFGSLSAITLVHGSRRPCQTFYEGPHDVRVVGRNASDTAPAKFLVFLLKDKGAPI
jgi:hypothetical protein